MPIIIFEFEGLKSGAKDLPFFLELGLDLLESLWWSEEPKKLDVIPAYNEIHRTVANTCSHL